MARAHRGGPWCRPCRLHLRAQDRRPGRGAHLRERRLCARGHAWRRHHGRGRLAQRAHHPRRAHASGRAGARAHGGRPFPHDRGARRGLYAQGQLRASERGGRRRRARPVCQPPQRRRRVASSERPQSHGHARPRHVYLRGGRYQPAPRAQPARVSELAARCRVLRQPQRGHLRHPCRGPCLLRRCPGAPRRARLRHRRRGGKGRFLCAARRAGLYRPCPALGHRVQVPARGEDDRSARDSRAGGPHGRAHPGGRVRSGDGGRLHHRARHAAQYRRGAPQGRARGRHDRGAQGGRRDPRGRGAGGRQAPRGHAALADAGDLSCVRQPRGARGGRGSLPLRLARLRGTAQGAPAALGEPRVHGRGRHRRRAGGQDARGRSGSRRGRLLYPHRRGHRGPGDGTQVRRRQRQEGRARGRPHPRGAKDRREGGRRARALQGTVPRPRAVRAGHPSRGQERGRAAGTALPVYRQAAFGQ